ncbi:MAG: histidine kinase N-terminal 7TM domain-containing protein [Patescibacteria group bacterium]
MDFSNINYYALSGLFNFFVALIFGLFVYLKDRKSEVNRAFLFLTTSIMVWSSGYFFWHISTGEKLALLFTRILMVGTIMVSPTFVHFVLALLGKTRQYKLFLRCSYSLFWFFNLANIFTLLIVSGVAPFLMFQYWPQPGFLFHFFLFAWIAYALYGTFLLIRSYPKADASQKAQIRYVLVGINLAYLAGGTNWPGWYGIPIPPILTPAASIYVIMIGYAALKHHLFNMRVLTVELLTFTIWGFLLLRLVTAGYSLGVFLPNLVLFVAVIIIGIFLIRAGLHEAKLNSQLDDLNHNLQKKVDEQTKEIRSAYEVEKKARVELEELDKTKTDFILAAQHNLRTPLTITKGYVEEIGAESEKLNSPQLKTFVDKTKSSLEILAQLISGLIDVTDLKVGKEGFTHNKKS